MFKSITLEVSLKPFKQTDEQYIRKVCAGIFRQWEPLLKNREEISIMLWPGDGSEILDYDGDLSKPFEWAYFMGTANLPLITPEEDQSLGLHSRKRYYMQNPPTITYQILKNIVCMLKEEGKKAFPSSRIRVGETFDIGPEFAISDFKYNRHREILGPVKFYGTFGLVDCTATLNADDRCYASYPDGIPEGTPFATFLGNQSRCFCKDIGFDYLWLSNGLGFSCDPWDLTGKIFDGERFYPEKLEPTSSKVFSFWKLFRQACPDLRIETRGTNNSAGIDYATDGVPLWDIYNGDFNILAPPNSPWAALNDNYGLEIMGHMTRICHLPEDQYLFRYYIHDPWWMNSPWYDRYDGVASDIYLPMAISRIDQEGNAQPASRLNLLTIDNSKGDMPDSCVYEPLPHLLKAEKDCADQPSFVLWLYPMKEYTTSKSPEALREMYFGDRFIMDAINQGFPLNTVVSTEIFKTLPSEVYKDRIIVTPNVMDEQICALLDRFASDGGKIIYYEGEDKPLPKLATGENVIRVSTNRSPSLLREALSAFGYHVSFITQENYIKLPVVAINRSNNAMIFSIYNPDTTTDTLLKFPLGAPILMGGEAIMENGAARYRFSRCEHRECRFYVQQSDGVVSAHERPPVSAKFRRRIGLSGLKDATVYYFPEAYCDQSIAVTDKKPDDSPVFDQDWTPVFHPIMGRGFKGEHKNGTLAFLMPFKQYLD